MNTRFLSAALATVFGFWIPDAAWGKGPAQILALPREGQVPAPQVERDRDREQPGEQTQAKRGAPPVDAPGRSGAAGVPGVAGIVVPALPPCPVVMVLMAPYGHDCVVTLSGQAPFWVGYVGSPYFQNSYGWPSAEFRPVDPSSSKPLSRQKATGLLRLQVEPQTAHVYVDGYYTATVGSLDLVAGPHRIEISAPNYETLSFEVNIVPSQTITYQGDLQPVSYEPYVPAKAGAPKTFYVIPGCYAGDRPPQRMALPQGCDISRLHSY